MHKVVASWLAGLYDSDKSVSRAAQDSFKQVFSSEEKARNVWRVYQAAILEHTRDVILRETMYTLSDERITSPEDAAAKYARTVGAAVQMITRLLGGSYIVRTRAAAC